MGDMMVQEPRTERKSVVRKRGVRRPWLQAAVAPLVFLGGVGCSLDGLLNSDKLPPEINDPAITRTANGARAAYNGTLIQFRQAFGGSSGFVAETGLLSDELQAIEGGVDLDQRIPTTAVGVYSDLHKVRGQAEQSIGLLTQYVPDQPALVGHLYALQGYAELFLAELFCSGIPLSTLDYSGDFTYKPGSTTEEVLTHAITLFDAALELAGDSTRFVNLARVGKARAFLGLGEYAQATAAAVGVADDYRYNVTYNNVTRGNAAAQNFAALGVTTTQWNISVPNREGFNGLDWRTSGDPRVEVTDQGASYQGIEVFHPDKYATDGSSPIVLASGVEARLVEAEAALHTGGAWLTILNALRTDNTFDVTATTPPDTLWHAGTGGVAGLRPLTDPGTPTAQVDLLFRERAFWLFLTGHRQGDLRRLIRQYGRNQAGIYPVGSYLNSAFVYGGEVTVPIQELENPLYTGCASRGA